MRARGLEDRKPDAGREMQQEWQARVREKGRGEPAGNEERSSMIGGIGTEYRFWMGNKELG